MARKRGPGRPKGSKNKMSDTVSLKRGRPAKSVYTATPTSERGLVDLVIKMLDMQSEIIWLKNQNNTQAQQLSKTISDINTVTRNLTERMNGVELVVGRFSEETKRQQPLGSNGQTAQAA